MMKPQEKKLTDKYFVGLFLCGPQAKGKLAWFSELWIVIYMYIWEQWGVEGLSDLPEIIQVFDLNPGLLLCTELSLIWEHF